MPPYPVLVLVQVLWASGLTIGCLGVGQWLLRRCGWSLGRSWTEAALGLGLGAAALSYLAFALTAARLLSHPTLLWVACAWTGLGAGLLVLRPREPHSPPAQRLGAFTWACLALVGVLAAFDLLRTLTPVWDWDSLAYHLALPKLYLQAGGFVFRPDIFHNCLPQFTEMLFLLGLIFPYGTAPQLLHFGFGCLAVFALLALGRETASPGTGAFAALVFFAQYVVHIETGTAMVDLAATAYGALALLAGARALARPQEPRWPALAMLLLGFVGAGKWQGLVLTALAGGAFAAQLWLEPALRAGTKVRRTAGLAALGLLPVVPYAVRAWVQGGNPVWPLAYGLFGGRGWDAAVAERVIRYHVNFGGMTKSWSGLLRLPFDLIAHGSHFGHGGAELAVPLLGGVWLTAAWWIWARRGRAALSPGWARLRWLLAAAAGTFLVVWYKWLPMELRYVLPLFPGLAWLAARAAADLWRRPLAAARWAAVVGGLCLLTVHPPVHRYSLLQTRVLAGRVTPAAYLDQQLPAYPACRFLNGAARPGVNTLIFGDNQGFYLDGEYLWGDAFLQNVVDYRSLATPERLLARLRELKVGWVLFRTDLFSPAYQPPAITRLMEQTLALGGQEAFRQGPVTVYRLLDPERPRRD